MYPADADARAQVDFLLCWDAGTLYPALSDAVYPEIGFKEKTDKHEANTKKFQETLKFLNDHLIKGPYMSGANMTIADISTAMSLSMLTLMEHSLYDNCENITSWLAKIESEPFYKEVDLAFQAVKAELANASKEAVVDAMKERQKKVTSF